MEMLKDKNALVIGGGSGMGAAVAVALAEAGARVTIAGRRIEKLEAVKGLSTVEIQTRTVDVSDRVSLDALFSWFDEESGDLDILVNAAGINVPKRSMAALSPDDWDAVLKVNLTGAYDCLRMALDRMRPRKDGLVVMINSVSGKRSNPLGGVALVPASPRRNAKTESVSPTSFPERSIRRFLTSAPFLLLLNTVRESFNLKTLPRR